MLGLLEYAMDRMSKIKKFLFLFTAVLMFQNTLFCSFHSDDEDTIPLLVDNSERSNSLGLEGKKKKKKKTYAAAVTSTASQLDRCVRRVGRFLKEQGFEQSRVTAYKEGISSDFEEKDFDDTIRVKNLLRGIVYRQKGEEPLLANLMEALYDEHDSEKEEEKTEEDEES